MQSIDFMRSWRDSEASAWLFSLTMHVGVLFALASLSFLLPSDPWVELTATSLETEELSPEEFQFSTESQDEVGALSEGGVDGARPEALVQADLSQLTVEIEPTSAIGEIQAFEFTQTILESPNVSENMMVKGMGSVGATGAAGAIDRIANEILLSLDQRPTLVVWLFDQSGSLSLQRELIAQRFERVYDELGIIEAAGNRAFQRHQDKPLLTSIASFGASIQMLTPKPTDDITKIKASVRSIVDDPSGRENVFQAVYYVADKFRSYRLKRDRRNVMIVVFTDEAGDDVGRLDAAVGLCRKFEIPVYVVGVPAPFGRLDTEVKYIDPDPTFDQTPQWPRVHQGPESLMPERIKLSLSGTGGRNGRDERIDSGFGPFGLCRLTHETGGLYFAVHPNRQVGGRVGRGETASMTAHLSTFFDTRVMRSYRPDYIPVEQYHRRLEENKARAALVTAANFSWTTPMENVQLRFPKVDEGQLARTLTFAQRAAAKLEPKINQIVATLKQGEADRPKLLKPRWQAGFDLAIGRALAVKIRAEGYNAMLAAAKQGMKFKKKKSDTWLLRPTDEVTINSTLTKEAKSARFYLERVVDQHPKTPWALLAQRELNDPLGWEWRERFTNVARRMENANNNNRPQPEMPVPPKKPRRKPPAL